MATLAQEFFTFITSESTITDVLGHRIYPDKARQKTLYPYSVVRKVTGGGISQHTKDSGRYSDARLQISIWSKTATDASGTITIAKIISDFLDNYSGPVGNINHAGIDLISEMDDHEKKTGLFSALVEIRIQYGET